MFDGSTLERFYTYIFHVLTYDEALQTHTTGKGFVANACHAIGVIANGHCFGNDDVADVVFRALNQSGRHEVVIRLISQDVFYADVFFIISEITPWQLVVPNLFSGSYMKAAGSEGTVLEGKSVALVGVGFGAVGIDIG